jgi:putative restriction endonuclease
MQLLFYSEIFRNLTVAKRNGREAPHKAILLLSVMDLIVSSETKDEKVLYTDSLKNQFSLNWDIHVKANSGFKCIMSTPFYHMKSECFWDLIPIKYGMISSKSTPSEASIKSLYKYARIEPELFELMNNMASRDVLRNVLLERFFNK